MDLNLHLYDLTVEHQHQPIGIDCESPRFAWKLKSSNQNVFQTAYQVRIYTEGQLIADTGKIESEESTERTVSEWKPSPMTRYHIQVDVWDNKGYTASCESFFETGRMGIPFHGGWVEPVQVPTPSTLETKDMSTIKDNPYAQMERDFAEFRPSQYIRIPFDANKKIQRARVYATAHGIYRLEVNGTLADDREFAPEITSYNKILQVQTYDVTHLLRDGANVFGVTVADGWWVGRVGTTSDCCQFGDKVGLLLEGVIEYEDGTEQIVTAEQGVSSTGALIFSDLFVGEKYDARREPEGWSLPGFDDSDWTPVLKVDYPMDNLVGQYTPPVRPLRILTPERVLTTPAGETLLDVGQVVAGVVGFTVDAPEGVTIKLEHSEVLDEHGNYFNNILGVNKEQTDTYITKAGKQTYRPHFTYHGFRYVKITGWPGALTAEQFKVYVFSSEMDDIGQFSTSDARINQLQSCIWWSQVANSICIPTDCPQREKAGWTGDIMAFAPTMCFNRSADAFLTGWLNNLRADQLSDGQVPVIIPYLPAYKKFMLDTFNQETSCGWGDAVIMVPYAMYKAYGDLRILETNYASMTHWMEYIVSRMENSHPADYESWDDEHKNRSRRLWNTDFHFGDWLIPSIVLGNPDGGAMSSTAFATMGVVAPAYAAFTAKNLAEIAEILGLEQDAARFHALYEEIRTAFIAEYIHADGTMDADFQGIYVIALKMGLVPEDIRPKMVAHLCDMIEKNRGCLDTGFLSILFLMDVLCENDRRDVAYQLLFQTKCPSWLYEIEHGATTMWESWGAIGEDGAVSTYSYNHYAFGCVGEWMYREIGGLQAIEPGYKKFRVAPDFNCGLTSASVENDTPYGTAAIRWKIEGSHATVEVTVPVNTTAEIDLPGMEQKTAGSGTYRFDIAI